MRSLKGLLLYTEEDSRRNRRAIQLFQEAGRALEMQVELVTDVKQAAYGDERGLRGQNREDKQKQEWAEPEQKRRQYPDFVINRTRDWHLGEAFERRGIPVFNSSEVTRICNDKAATLEIAESLGIPVLPWVKGTDEAECVAFYRAIAGPMVAKICEGHGGTEVLWVDSEEALHRVSETFRGRNWILQQAAAFPGKDLRIYLLGDRVVQAMLRTAEEGFKSNYCLGGRAEVYTCRETELEAAKKLTAHLQPDYVGVDFLFHENGQMVLNEVEDAVGARMIYTHTNIDIIREYMEDIRGKLEKRKKYGMY